MHRVKRLFAWISNGEWARSGVRQTRSFLLWPGDVRKTFPHFASANSMSEHTILARGKPNATCDDCRIDSQLSREMDSSFR